MGFGTILRFVGGVIVGAAIIPGAFVAAVVAIVAYGAVGPRPWAAREPQGPSRADYELSGAALSSLHGVSMSSRWGGVLEQTCRGPCDDLQLKGSHQLADVEMKDAEGRCVFCRRKAWPMELSRSGPVSQEVHR